MAEGVKPVETKVEPAGAQPVVAETHEKDTADEVLAIQADLIQTQTERENYRKGLLKAKGKLTPEELAEEDERMRSIAREEYLKTKEGDLAKRLQEANEKLIKENRELKTANRARAGIQPASTGASQPTETVVNSPLTEEFRIELKTKRHWTDAMIKDLEDKQRERQAGIKR